MPDSRPKEPAPHSGIYQYLDDVPDRYRLYHHAEAYQDRDVFGEFLEEEVLPNIESEWSRDGAYRQSRRWKEYMADRDRHHALARPLDVDAFAQELLDDKAPRTALRYWRRLESFYRWLMWRSDHPHVYSPPLIAAVQYDRSATLWWCQYD